MSDPQAPGAPPVEERPSRPGPWALLWAVVRGCAVGVLSIAAGLAVAYAVIPAPQAQPCGEDELTCLPDFGPILAAVAVIGTVVLVVSPLAARLVRLARPWLFVLAGVWVDMLLVLGGVANAAVQVILALAPYALLAMWTVTHPAGGARSASLPGRSA